MEVLIGIIVFAIIIWALAAGRSNPRAPDVMTEQELIEDGMTKAQARRELRAQRAEARAEARANSEAIRTAATTARLASSWLKKLK